MGRISESKRDEMIDTLESYTETIVSVECEKCNKGTYINNYLEPGKEMYELGWRIIRNKCLCPSCVKKAEKKNKQH